MKVVVLCGDVPGPKGSWHGILSFPGVDSWTSRDTFGLGRNVTSSFLNSSIKGVLWGEGGSLITS